MKVIIVEGKTDKEKIQQVIDEPVRIICTFGTMGQEQADNLALSLEDEEVYILLDSDFSGEKARKQLKQLLPNATHLYTLKEYREIAATPAEFLKTTFNAANIATK